LETRFGAAASPIQRRHLRPVCLNSIDYLYVRRLLENWTAISLSQLAAMLNNEKWAVTTYNRRLTCLNTFLSWLMESGTVQFNLLKGVTRKHNKGKKKNLKRKPLEVHEIAVFLKAIKDDAYTSPSSRFKHSYYYPFLLFIFSTGVRHAEAIELSGKSPVYARITINGKIY
jgi:integrase